ncbi:PREDICTED: methyltransferase-like protein 5 isoform X2 [Camelina sativa]|uniref:Methyltransferase-like protein 5 isoform X2 n=1 Tax=Camelina sativa TaxID=90675 RepID=A0ABM1RD44_CAMSA|nr:PREDICTED: methyltransferase-like protein 5 isoform X2 [Camelina sativa]
MMNTLEKEISPRRLLLRSSLRPMEKAVEYKRALTAAKLEKAENSYGDITDKVVPDFGCGCGTLSVAAALLDSASVIGFDIDPQSLETATLNAEELEIVDAPELLCWIFVYHLYHLYLDHRRVEALGLLC